MQAQAKEPRTRSDGHATWWLAAALLPVLVVPFLRIAAPDLWIDEVFTYNVATADARDHWRLVYDVYDHPPLFFHVLWLAGRLSDSSTFLGFFPALFVALGGVATVVYLWYCGGGQTRGPLALFVGWGYSLAPIVAYQAWNLRHYGLFLLVGLLYVLGWDAALRGRRRMLWGSAALAGLGMLTHHFMAFVLLAVEIVGLAWLIREHRREALAITAKRAAIVLPFVLLWALVAWRQYPGSGGERVALLLNYEGLSALRDVWARIHGAADLFELPRWSLWLAVACGCALSVLDFATARWREPADWLWLSAAYVPIGLVFALSYVMPALEARVLLVSCAAMWVVHARALVRLGRWGWLAAAGALAVLAAGFAVHLTHRYHYPPYHEWAPLIINVVQPGEALVLAPGSDRTLYEYYARRAGLEMPETIDIPLPVVVPDDYAAAMEALPRRAAAYRRVWVVYEMPGFWDPSYAVQEYFEGNWIVGEYQALWGLNWVVTYYDNPRFASGGAGS